MDVYGGILDQGSIELWMYVVHSSMVLWSKSLIDLIQLVAYLVGEAGSLRSMGYAVGEGWMSMVTPVISLLGHFGRCRFRYNLRLEIRYPKCRS